MPLCQSAHLVQCEARSLWASTILHTAVLRYFYLFSFHADLCCEKSQKTHILHGRDALFSPKAIICFREFWFCQSSFWFWIRQHFCWGMIFQDFDIFFNPLFVIKENQQSDSSHKSSKWSDRHQVLVLLIDVQFMYTLFDAENVIFVVMKNVLLMVWTLQAIYFCRTL